MKVTSPRVRKVQWARRSVQLLAVAFLLAVPALARYNNYLAARELDAKIEKWEGTLAGETLAAIDSVLRALPGGEVERAGRIQRDRERVIARAQTLRGGPWSAEIGPLSLTDPLAGAEAIAASKRLPWVLATGLLLPLALTVALGRVFCSWICPMGLLFELNDKLRRALRFLEIQPRNVRVSRRVKYGLLGAGVALAAVLSAPVLGYLYPPAVLGRETHDLVFAVFDRAEMGRFGLWLGSLGWMALFLVGISLFELFVSRRWWCRTVCPGGALYSLIGWARPVRVKLRQESCTGCARCTAVCPMGLNPMRNQMGMECDNCGVCLGACDDGALDFALAGPFSPPVKELPVARRVAEHEEAA